MKRFRENILFMVIGTLISITFSYVLAESIINSKDVYYEDKSGLAVNNVQDAIDGTCTKFEEKVDAFLDKVYPVGSVYISTTLDTPAKVKTAIGGTWEVYGKGQTLVGVDTSQNEFKTVNNTGGVKSVSYTPKGTIGSTGLTIDQIPSHSHSYDKVNANTGSHTLTIAEIPSHNHLAINSTIPAWAGTDGGGINLSWPSSSEPTNNKWGYNTLSRFITAQGGGGGHTHPISTTSTSTGAAGKGTTSDGHTHSFTGTAASISTLQPYITVYMYKRTA